MSGPCPSCGYITCQCKPLENHNPAPPAKVKRRKAREAFLINPKVNKFARSLARGFNSGEAAKKAGISTATASVWKKNANFRELMGIILEENKSGLVKVGQVVQEALDAVYVRVDKHGNQYEGKDWNTRLKASDMVLKVFGAYKENDKEQINEEEVLGDIPEDA